MVTAGETGAGLTLPMCDLFIPRSFSASPLLIATSTARGAALVSCKRINFICLCG